MVTQGRVLVMLVGREQPVTYDETRLAKPVISSTLTYVRTVKARKRDLNVIFA